MSFGGGNLRERCAELEHMVETRDESIRNLVKLLDKRQVRTEELEQLVISLYVCATGGDCDDCPMNGAVAVRGRDIKCDELDERMREMGIEAD